MNTEREQQIYAVFAAALACDPAGRSTLLDGVCGADAELRSAVDRLLADDELASQDDFLILQDSGENEAGIAPGAIWLQLAARVREELAIHPTRKAGFDDEGTGRDALAPSDRPTVLRATSSLVGASDWPVIPGYEFLEYLGGGGMGVVYKVRQRALDRVVVLKVIHERIQKDAAVIERFRREMLAAGRLAHPNLVSVHDAGQMGDIHYFTMEYIDGMDLARVVRERGPLSVERACEYVRQASLGLQHAHERGLVHRDVKPGNLVVTADETTVKVLDLGLARLLDQGNDEDALTRPGTVLGTLDFIAPEQLLDSRKVDARADLYGLGCTLYYLLTGAVPFPGSTPGEKIAGHLSGVARPIGELRPDVPPALAALLRRLMARRPEDRFERAGDLASALAALTSTVRPERKTRLYAAISLVGCLAVLVAGVGWNYLVKRRGDSVSGTGKSHRAAESRRPGGLPSGSLSDAVAALAKLGAKIERDEHRPGKPVKIVNLEFASVTERELALLSGFTELEELDLPPSVGDEVLSHLEGLVHLRRLKLTGNSITDAGLVHIKGLTDLELLWMDGCKISDAGIDHLVGLRKLATLALGDSAISDDCLPQIAQFPKLWFLKISNTRVTDAGLRAFRKTRQLGSVNLSGTAINGSGLAHLTSLPQLMYLSLAGTKVDDKEAQRLHAFPQLQSLDLSDLRMSDEAFECLKGLTQLEVLYLNRTPIGSRGMAVLAGLTNLRTLELAGTEIRDGDLRHLSGLSRIQTLDLSDTAVTDHGVEHLSALTALHRLDLNVTAVGDHGVRIVARLKNLRTLSIQGTKVTPEALRELREALPEIHISR